MYLCSRGLEGALMDIICVFSPVPQGVIQNGARMMSQGLFPGIRPLPINPIVSRTAAVRSVVSLQVTFNPSHYSWHDWQVYQPTGIIPTLRSMCDVWRLFLYVSLEQDGQVVRRTLQPKASVLAYMMSHELLITWHFLMPWLMCIDRMSGRETFIRSDARLCTSSH